MFGFFYKAFFENGLIEYEYDNVFIGISDKLPVAQSSEVKNWKYMSLPELAKEINMHPDEYTQWMKICLPRVKNYIENLLIKTHLVQTL